MIKPEQVLKTQGQMSIIFTKVALSSIVKDVPIALLSVPHHGLIEEEKTMG